MPRSNLKLLGRNLSALVAISLGLGLTSARAERLINPIAVFTGLDKITGLTTTFEVDVGQERKFGGLIVRADVCYTRPVTDEPKTTAFVEVREVRVSGQEVTIFSGWMFAQSPGLSAVEHPVYDVWLINCRDPKAPPPVVEVQPQKPTEGGEGGENMKEDEPQD